MSKTFPLSSVLTLIFSRRTIFRYFSSSPSTFDVRSSMTCKYVRQTYNHVEKISFVLLSLQNSNQENLHSLQRNLKKFVSSSQLFCFSRQKDVKKLSFWSKLENWIFSRRTNTFSFHKKFLYSILFFLYLNALHTPCRKKSAKRRVNLILFSPSTIIISSFSYAFHAKEGIFKRFSMTFYSRSKKNLLAAHFCMNYFVRSAKLFIVF